MALGSRKSASRPFLKIRCDGPLKQIDGFKGSKIHWKTENLKDGRGLGERKPGLRRKRRNLDTKEMEFLRKTKAEESREE